MARMVFGLDSLAIFLCFYILRRLLAIAALSSPTPARPTSFNNVRLGSADGGPRDGPCCCRLPPSRRCRRLPLLPCALPSAAPAGAPLAIAATERRCQFSQLTAYLLKQWLRGIVFLFCSLTLHIDQIPVQHAKTFSVSYFGIDSHGLRSSVTFPVLLNCVYAVRDTCISQPI